MSKTRSFSGGTREEALARAAEELGVDASDIEVDEVVVKTRFSDGEEREEIEIKVRVDEDDVDDSGFLEGFAPRKPAPPPASDPTPAPPAPRLGPVDDPPERAPAPADESRDTGPASDDVPAERTNPGADADPADLDEAHPAVLAPKAEEFLKGLLERMDVGADLEIEWDLENVYIEIVADEGLGGLIIGRKGQTLDALQYLVNRVILPGAAARGRIYLDTENYRAKHRRKLEEMAVRLRDQAIRNRRPVTVEELSARDRWIIHQALLDDRSVTTRSVGDNYDRKLMIIPR